MNTIDRAVKAAGLKEGSRILDIGCGEGDVLEHLVTDLGMKAEGIDINVAKIAEAREKHPDLDVKFGDGEFLEDYTSFTFDAVLMEGCLSRINLPDEALHEAYCVLKKGGKLIVIDRYEKEPDSKQVEAVRIEAMRQAKMPRKDMECEDEGLKARFVDFRFEDRFFKDPLIRQIEETGYGSVAFEDAEDGGDNKEGIGTFLLVATKPVM